MMTTSRFVLLISAIALILLALVPAVSANEIYNETTDEIYNEIFTISTDDSIIVKSKASGSYYGTIAVNGIAFSNTMRNLDIRAVVVQGPASKFYNLPTVPAAWWPVSFIDRYGTVVGSGTYSYFFYEVDSTKYVQISVDIDDIDLSNPAIHAVKLSNAPTGYSYLKMKHYSESTSLSPASDLSNLVNTDTSGYACLLSELYLTSSKELVDVRMSSDILHTTVYSQTWQNQIVVEDEGPGTVFHIIRDFPVNTYSTVSIITSTGITINSVNTNDNREFRLMKDLYPLDVTIDPIIAPPYQRIISLDSGEPGEPGEPGDSTSLTVYIKNSQTGALIAYSNVVIEALVNDEYYPVVNRTEPSGIFSINLQPTGGGPPNPDGYRLIVTADGYNNPMPEINFTVDDYKQSIYCLLDPIAGGPADENKTFIDFFVSDMFGNPIPDATVKFGKYTLLTNSAGYTVFEVPKNDYYTYTVIKSGYNHLTGNTVIGDAPRNTINTYLTTVITTPTQPPTQPPGGIPDDDDDSDGFLVQAVRGIGLAFGVGFSTAKIIFGMLLALSIGFTTAKKLRGGAAEFGMGLLGGTMLGVLIGLLPVWIIVVLLLVVGLYVGNRYVGGSNNG